jgi:hypothetical protein
VLEGAHREWPPRYGRAVVARRWALNAGLISPYGVT